MTSVRLRYAKLHGSYAVLQGGSVADALVDLTGLIEQTLFLYCILILTTTRALNLPPLALNDL
jgi:hypothetical protein